jgi:hypothetical protein
MFELLDGDALGGTFRLNGQSKKSDQNHPIQFQVTTPQRAGFFFSFRHAPKEELRIEFCRNAKLTNLTERDGHVSPKP